jgi:hemerythrin-like metal-binding protein
MATGGRQGRRLIKINACGDAAALVFLNIREGRSSVVLVRWKDEFEIGIPSVDHEHRALIKVINLLGEQLDSRAGVPEISVTLDEIRRLIAAHFAMEEHVMRDMGYGEYAEHKADHARLLEEIRDIILSVEHGGYTDRRLELGERIGRWFSRHFETFDARLHSLTQNALAETRRGRKARVDERA